MIYIIVLLFAVSSVVFALIGNKRKLIWIQGIGLGCAIAGFMFSMWNLASLLLG